MMIKRGLNLLTNQEISQELPPNYAELKKAANRTSSWRDRLQAVEELGNWQHKQVIDVLTHVMTDDLVYKVQEAAYNKLATFGVDVKRPSENKRELFQGIDKILLRIKKSLPKDHTFAEFKEKLQKMRTDVYDAYEGEKGESFEAWLQDKWEKASVR